MIVKLYEGTQIIVSQSEGQKIISSMVDGKKVIIVKGQAIRPNAIAAVVEGGATEPDIIGKDRQINPPEIKLGKGYKSFLAKKKKLQKKLSV